MSAPRRILALALAAAVLTGPALAAERLVPLSKVFAYLDLYLKLPAGERNRFALTYRFTQGGKPLSGAVKAWIVQGTARLPLGFGADGMAERLPTLQQLQDGSRLALETPSQAKFGVQLGVEPLVAPAADIDAPALAAAVDQAAVGVRKAAGPMGFITPRMERVYFVGVASGELVWPDGRRTLLPISHGMPAFDAASGRKARAVHFVRLPTRMEIGPAK